MIALLLDHLWQSSLCAGIAGLLALAMRRNGAAVRFWLWFAASVKFLVPFSVLTMLGASLLTLVAAPVTAPTLMLMEPLARPFSAAPPVGSAIPEVPAPAAAHLDMASALLALWAAGFLVLALRWTIRWLRVRALMRAASQMQVDAPVAVKFSTSRLEPGLVGILRPVILLPHGIEQQLTAAELKAVLAHELCHWRRHDNLLAAVHMLVEALFWFFPLVWWLGARLNAERERACDESVVAEGNDPENYAEGILKVCRAYLQSPLACVAGVSGAGLKQRIEAIVENRLGVRLNAARKLVLGASAATALVLPLALGLATAPVVPMQARGAVSSLRQIVQNIAAQSQPASALPSDQLARNQDVPQVVRVNALTASKANSPPEERDVAPPVPPSPAALAPLSMEGQPASAPGMALNVGSETGAESAAKPIPPASMPNAPPPVTTASVAASPAPSNGQRSWATAPSPICARACPAALKLYQRAPAGKGDPNASADTLPQGVPVWAYPPVGKGDPNAISCWAYRATPPIRGLQCARNSEWARLNAGSNHGDQGGNSGPPSGGASPGAAGGALSGPNGGRP